MRPNRPSKSMPGQFCLCFALLGLLIGAIYLSMVTMIEPPKSPDYWIFVTILWVLVGMILIILLLQYLTRAHASSQGYSY